jgi:hypothetical protein
MVLKSLAYGAGQHHHSVETKLLLSFTIHSVSKIGIQEHFSAPIRHFAGGED